MHGYRKKKIHKNLEEYIPTFLPNIKTILAPYVTAFNKSNRAVTDRFSLKEGFEKAWSLCCTKLFLYLNNLNELSLNNLLGQMNKIKQNILEPSLIFLNQYNNLKYERDKLRVEFLQALSIEAMSRYGEELIIKIYDGDKLLLEAWKDHLLANYFSFWNHRKNYSAYRLSGKEIYELNQLHKFSFFPANKLRPHDDTIDGSIPHILGHGWFHHKKNLTAGFALSDDPFDDLFQRTQQYQACLAYYQNPAQNNLGLGPRVKEVAPGVLFAYDRKNRIMRIVSFSPTEIFEENGQVKIRSCHSEIEIIQL